MPDCTCCDLCTLIYSGNMLRNRKRNHKQYGFGHHHGMGSFIRCNPRIKLFSSVHLSPEVTMQALPHMVKGEYDIQALGRLFIWTLGISLGISSFGMLWFARRDI